MIALRQHSVYGVVCFCSAGLSVSSLHTVAVEYAELTLGLRSFYWGAGLKHDCTHLVLADWFWCKVLTSVWKAPDASDLSSYYSYPGWGRVKGDQGYKLYLFLSISSPPITTPSNICIQCWHFYENNFADGVRSGHFKARAVFLTLWVACTLCTTSFCLIWFSSVQKLF